MAGKEIAVKKYVVRLNAEERDELNQLIRKGKRSAQLLTKARILLKADISDAGEGWSDGRIAAALDTSIATVGAKRRQLGRRGCEAVLARKYNSNSARRRIFDGAAEAKLIALTLSRSGIGRPAIGPLGASSEEQDWCWRRGAAAGVRVRIRGGR